MSSGFLLDTDILVDFLKGYLPAVSFINDNAFRISLSAITVSELYAGVRDNRELSELDDFCQIFPIHPVSPEIARAGVLLKRRYCKGGETTDKIR